MSVRLSGSDLLRCASRDRLFVTDQNHIGPPYYPGYRLMRPALGFAGLGRYVPCRQSLGDSFQRPSLGPHGADVRDHGLLGLVRSERDTIGG